MLRPGGVAVFNADVLQSDKKADKDDAASADKFRLHFTGRYHHRVKYVKSHAKAHGLVVVDGHHQKAPEKGHTVIKAETTLAWHAQSKKVIQVDASPVRAETAVFAFRKA